MLRAGKNNRGFTLIELLVTLAIVGLIMGLVVGQTGRLLSSDMKAAAKKLSSTIRFLYNKSATESVTLRLVFDIDENSYWVEGTSESFTLTKEEEETFQNQKSKIKDQKEEKKEETNSIQPKEASFSPQESYILKPVKLPGGVFFKDIYAEHQIDRLSSGKAYIYFFPQGYVERSVINLRNESDDVHYSLQVSPISGTVKIESAYKEPEIER
ncbi:MAG: hypothetical protein A3F82_01760 [Deltaproteobacteria bacterium RIFCSPLOWO2_12_FULL_44_12]|nr:MAG: hypothetical protein A2712_03200 [Deltaproteobacteria bacterium RIFCSPHIGHO2_01_FULL_43_49]OGQ16200.1 MAG: hypothetical protein A3D22_01170 [Deltaproteobacteria bacterium RIFCSPHIGHO2_02_FULL_44_53]OGQ29160.1 MAG: hypothetical protein A3D98_04955 [Deltaproteobacteria bacterium RIFCSPHIGHO2_12_FULL_44_21]OGQ32717.1 MAG: hypothetical protein A2979_09100 [Deltaproteobacteria bacterium RIFCSPLOWO2_01_FULL_45_74]OGQ41819.1 MAG: hypothetical protein A3I70_08885 [Deltaproteobacteria bacterium 